ncbi:hypothetical protein ACFL6M_01930 [Candidatus Eisenbacteria bacterium]|uniref:DUF2231 domain-containing protein n=1 Tax=Eiseniibacteriota bacterium TaxID=2212470 RepID=A0ABV6YJ21_UNCEI
MTPTEEAEHKQAPNAGELAKTPRYSPEVLLAYFVYGGLLMGLLLFGLNTIRRGQKIVGGMIAGMATLAILVSFLPSSTGGTSFRGLSLHFLAVFIGIGVLNWEGPAFANWISRGGREARWWPPLLIFIGLIVVGFLVSYAVVPPSEDW